MELKFLSKEINSAKLFKNVLHFVALSIPILLFCYPILKGINNFAEFDWDQFFSFYESVRISVATYHQFPWWNPWMAGGTPLFANPQVGVFSFHTLFVILWGALPGLKLGVIFYYLAGFWGMYALTFLISKDKNKSIFLSYIWAFSSFMVFHTHVGHYAFLSYLLTPWVVYFFLKKKNSFFWAAGCGLFLAALINCNLSYITLEILFGFLIAVIIELFIFRFKKPIIMSDVIAGAVSLILSFPKLFFSMQYVLQFPREKFLEPPLAINYVMRALVYPFQSLSDKSNLDMGWWEMANYISIPILIIFLIIFGWSIFQAYKRKSFSIAIVCALTILTFLVGLGAFSKYAPYSLLSMIPPFNYMHVATRWFGWTFFGILMAIALFKEYKKIVVAFLFVGAIELFVINAPLMNIFKYNVFYIPPANDSFQQYDNFNLVFIPNAFSSQFFAIKSGYGEIRGYEPLFGYDRYRPTKRCGINNGCNFISSNVKLISWSPNKIILERTGEGPIEINMNPSSYFLINGKRMNIPKVTELDKEFLINEKDKYIIIEANPLK
jgi:hypothetical protein